ncbi:YihY/virulence factor BrkB family protein [Planomonospora sp. ID67723]|uniref:YihY/virulence factor BrkB family protein n=1 Tax=Planomonospora sp. ID67723 TaxID=2738134 RepID=UPI0018C3E696|nr:YihY/virulence factor BrkB family protein [Planomonospora sp. ID67723]MBG0832622.1 YihY/virulence factor BrkB family protein [Planomonospora sp. ID67723]
MTATARTSRWTGGFIRGWAHARRRYGWLDHLVRAGVHYDRTDAGRLSAGMTYYAFYATFALALLGFVIMGHVLDTPTALGQVERYLSDTFPRLDVEALRDARDTAGVIASFGLPLTGLFWVDSMRSSIRAVWGLEQYPGNFFLRWLIDLGVLVMLGLLLSASLTLSFGAQTALTWLVEQTVGIEAAPAQWVLSATAFVLGICVNTLLSMALLTLTPRLHLPARRLIGPALIMTIGLELLKTIGQVYFNISSANPAYQVVAGAVGMLLFLKLINVLILFAAAHAATSRHGTVVDLTTRQLVGEPRTEVVTAPAIPEVKAGSQAQEEQAQEEQAREEQAREEQAEEGRPGKPQPVTSRAKPRRYDFRSRRSP